MLIKGIFKVITFLIIVTLLGCDNPPECKFSTIGCRLFVDSDFVNDWRIVGIQGYVDDGTYARIDSVEDKDNGLLVCDFLDSLISKSSSATNNIAEITLVATLKRKDESRLTLIPEYCTFEFNKRILRMDTTIRAIAVSIG